MDRARYLFDLVKEKGEEAIDRFILERKAEELFLDFKRSANNGDSEHLDQKDIEQYERAISGFGNSDGGIVVWGVDCRKDFDGADVAKAIFPITNPRRFESNLNHLTSGRTLPHHSKVENYSFGSPGTDAGYVVTYIPQSNVAPLQTANSKDFYIRVGSSFVKAPRGVLAGLFGKRPEPVIFPMFAEAFKWDQFSRSLGVSLGIILGNGGATLLKDAYLSVHIHNYLGEKSEIGIRLVDPQNWNSYSLFDRFHSYVAKDEFRIAPFASSLPIRFEVNLHPPFEEGVRIEVFFGCENSPVYPFTIESSLEAVNNGYDTFIKKNLSHIKLGPISNEIDSSIRKGIRALFPLPKQFSGIQGYDEYLSIINKQNDIDMSTKME